MTLRPGRYIMYWFGHPLGTEAATASVPLAITGTHCDDVLASTHGKVKLIVPTFRFDPPDLPRISNLLIFQVERATCRASSASRRRAAGFEPDLAQAMLSVSPTGERSCSSSERIARSPALAHWPRSIGIDRPALR